MEEYQVMIQSREWLVGWGTLSLINAGLAQGKNRSGLLWWLLSLILGPLATLIIVLLSKAPHKV
ncbi:antitermination protein NusB [Microbulbifer pacificus]|uniref:antitermination protein NusB n=1 Tax=Microbulbifer pacificus TaxID=407164 RepID=UPI0018F89720|nr:antitermination protein NusB [Microbulbifer pacificus]